MNLKYNCHKCGHENVIINLADVIKMGLGGMGSGGVMAENPFTGGLLSSTTFGSGLGGLPSLLSGISAREFKHNCTKCNELNIVQI